MLTQWLIKNLIKNNEDISLPKVRGRYVYLAGIIGIIINFLLFIIKISVGLFVGSIAITADAFNNLSDTTSSIITIVGVKLANRPADKEHPYGHGRIEYLSALIVAALVMFVGFQLGSSSINRIFNPEPVLFNGLSFILLFVSVIVKWWLSRFNRNIGEKVNSSALKAAGVDALGDVLISSTVLLSFTLSAFLPFSIDGFVGAGVAIFILYMSYNLMKETINPLLGEAPDPELVKNITTQLMTYPHICGIHDLIIHNYGVGRVMASIHAEFPASLDIMEIHEIIDKAEREISEACNLHLVIHMDPISLETDEIKEMRAELQLIIDEHPAIISLHDFRIVGKEPNKNLIFDLVVDVHKLTKVETEEKIKGDVETRIKAKHPNYQCIIVVDKNFSDYTLNS